MEANLTSRTIAGLKWSYAGAAANMVLQIGITAVMVRLVAPEAFGLIAMAGVVLRFAGYFAQLGLGTAIIQRNDLREEDVRAAFTLSLLLSLIFFGLLWVFAPVIVGLFGNSELVPVVRILGVTLILTGLSTPSLSLLRRDMMFRPLAMIDTTSFLIGYGAVGILLAMNHRGVWSLVIATLSQGLLTVLLAYGAVRHSLVPLFSVNRFSGLSRFGGKISVIGFLEFIGSSLDTVWIGRSLGATVLGYYNRAFRLANLPVQYASSGLSRVLLPSFSRIQSDRERLRRAYLSTLMLGAGLLIPVCMGIGMASNEIVLVVLGPEWIPSIPILRILAYAAALNLLSHFGGVVCEATGTLDVKVLVQVGYVAAVAFLFSFLGGMGGIGFAYSLLVGGILLFGSYAVITSRLFEITRREFIRAFAPGLFVGAILGALLFIARAVMFASGFPIPLMFAIELMIGSAGMVLLYFTPPGAPLRREIRNRLTGSGILKNDNSEPRSLLRYARNMLRGS